MKLQTWLELSIIIENGDPIKDICDEDELINYILDLRARLNLQCDQV